MSGYDHPSGRIVASPTHTSDGFAIDSGRAPSSTTTDYRTSIHFLTSPSSTNTESSGDKGVPPNSVPVSTLVAGEAARDRGYSYPEPRRNPVSLPPIHIRAAGPTYREDELTGMAGLMELSAPKAAHSMDARQMGDDAYGAGVRQMSAGEAYNKDVRMADAYNKDVRMADAYNKDVRMAEAYTKDVRMAEAYSSSASSNSAASRSVPQTQAMGAGAVVTPPYTGQAHYAQYSAYAQAQAQAQAQARYAAPMMASPLTPESQTAGKGTRSFPAIDDTQGARQRSRSTDSMQTHGAYAGSALPYVLGNANIRNRAMTTAQRQRTSDTPLFPVLLHRIITDPQNEAWIRWCDDGQAFKFSSADNLLACLQAAGLRAQNYHSVEKNLNDYRFTRLTDQRRKIPDLDGKLWWMFSHPQFLRDFPDGIVNIQRRRRTNPPAVSPQPALPHYPPPQGPDAWM